MLNVFRFIALFSACLLCVLGTFIFVKGRLSKLHRTFAIWLLFCGLWSFGFFLTMFSAMPYAVALWSSRVSHFFGGLTAILFLRFVLMFLEPELRYRPRAIHRVLAVGTGMGCLTPWLVKALPPKLFFPYYPEAGPLYPLLLASYFWTYGTSYVMLYKAYRNTSLDRPKRMQCLLTLVGVFLAWVSVATLFLPIYNIAVTPQLVFFPLIFFATIYSIIRYRFLDIRVVITRAGLLLVVYLFVLGFPFMIGGFGRPWLGQRFGEAWWLVPLGLCTALATAGPFAYAYLRRQAEEALLREQRRYQRTLQHAARGMTQVRNLTKLINLVTRLVSRTVGLTHASLLLWDGTAHRYVLRASHGPKRLALQSRYGVEQTHPLIQWLQTYRRVLVDDELAHAPDPRVSQELASLGATLVIPGFIEHRLVGFLALGRKLSGRGFSAEDLHAFATLANEAAVAIDNAISYEELLKANEQLKAASERLLLQERLAAAGQFATGMAHEIKNPLSAIKTFAQYLPEKYLDAAFRDKFFRIVQAEIDRINTIVQELLDFAKPAPLQLQPVHLSTLVEDTLSLLSDQCFKQGIEVQKAFGENGLTIEADPHQLKQVILNVLLNSLEAMPRGGRLEVTIEQRRKRLALRVTDTGCGIAPDYLRHVWDPFFTTKERGMGLGLAIVKGIIERHGGQVTLSSTPGKGTTAEFFLPFTPYFRLVVLRRPSANFD